MLLDIVRGLFGAIAIIGLIYVIRKLILMRRSEKTFLNTERMVSARTYRAEDYEGISSDLAFEEVTSDLEDLDDLDVLPVDPKPQDRSPRGRFDQ